MGLILDTSLLVADERGKFEMTSFLRQFAREQPMITAITASELLHGVERTADAARRTKRQRHVEQILATVPVLAFDLDQARVHARIWAELASRGQMIGPYDLLIAAAGLGLVHRIATLNAQEFHRVSGLSVVDATPFRRP
jgi:tRNA(fMet)-specific endonuclease VapC